MEKDLNKAHVLRLAGTMQELNKLRTNYATNWANIQLVKYCINADPTHPDTEEADKFMWDTFYQKALKDIQSHGDKIWTEVEDRFFKDLDYNVDFVSGGENKNIYSQINNGNALLMALAKDPTITQDPMKKKILFKVMSAMGWHMSELEDMDNEQLQTNQEQNGLQPIQGQLQQGQGGQLGGITPSTVQPANGVVQQ